MDTVTDRPKVMSVEHVWAGYEHEPVLEDINLSVYERDFIGLVGPNGGGKTTLIKVLLGLIAPSQGRVRIMNRPVMEGRRHIGYVPQVFEFDRDFPISVWDVTRMGRVGRRGLLRRYSSEDDALVAEALRQVDMLDLQSSSIGELSGGQRQRAFIARALATQPQILLLDEPTSSIDPQGRTSIYELLHRLNQRITILMVSHDIGAISTHAKTVGCLNRRLAYQGQQHITGEMLELGYQCPIDLIAQGVPHRVTAEHDGLPTQGQVEESQQ